MEEEGGYVNGKDGESSEATSDPAPLSEAERGSDPASDSNGERRAGVAGEDGPHPDRRRDDPHPNPLPEGEGVPGAGGTAAVPVGESPEIEVLRGELAEARARVVESHRRVLLAEHGGQLVPELVAGETVEALDASVEVARAAYERVRSATAAELAARVQVGAGNGARTGAVDVEVMSAMQKIAHGLKRGQD